VRTSRGEYRADQLVFCGGPWTERLVRDLGVPLVVTRQVLGWVWPIEPALFELGTLPVWAIGRGDGSLYYGFPILPDGGSVGFKIALHARGTPADPDRVAREVLPGDEETFRACLRQHIPRADGPLLAMRTCLYTNSPDGHFILDRHPRHPRVHLACGFSGHGFKFASVIGEVLADWCTAGRTDLPVEFLSLARFGR
jgi:sarcosine oxidase